MAFRMLSFVWYCSLHLAVVSGNSSSSSSSGVTASTRPRSLPRPPFLAHVTHEDLQQALQVASQRHKAAVTQALDNYPVSQCSDHNIRDVTLASHTLHTSTALPDFHTELSTDIHVGTVFSPTDCAHVIDAAESHFATHHNGAWTLQQSGQYDVLGFYIRTVPAVHEWFLQQVRTKLFAVLSRTYPDFCNSPDDLCVDNAYLFKYTPETGRRTDVHTDSGCLSFTICLNAKEEYDGGGTWFQGLDQGVLEMDVGQVTFRPGGVKHCGFAVTKGTRYIIGGFCMHRSKPEHVRMLLSANDVASLEAAVCLNPDCDAGYNLLANAYEKKGDKLKAQKVLEYCLQNVHPEAGEVAYSLGSLYVDQRLFKKAAECFRICLRTDDADVDAMMGLAQTAAALGDADVELEYYQKIVETPGAKSSVIGTAYCNLGVLHEGKDEELAYYRQCLELLPENFEARYSLACAHAGRNEWQDAVLSFRQAIPKAGGQENENKAVQSLYHAAARLLQSQAQAPGTREEMIQQFEEIMGVENFAKVTAMASQR